MLIYIDESGNPHPKDGNPNSVIAAICIPEGTHRKINRQLYAIKRKFMDNPDKELKAKGLLTPYVFEHDARRRELVESVFELIGSLEELAIFAVVRLTNSRRAGQLSTAFITCQKICFTVSLFRELSKLLKTLPL